jgi:type VI secretion system secreted protein VgrG
MSLPQHLQLEIEGHAGDLRVFSARVVERVHEPFSVRVVCAPADPTIELQPADLLTAPARFSFGHHDGSDRVLEGVVEAIDAVGRAFEVTVTPAIHLLGDSRDHRVFLDEDAIAITKQVLADHGLQVRSAVTRALPKRAQCVQGFESDLAFVSRILAEDGVAWYQPVDAPKAIALADGATGHDDAPGVDELTFVDGGDKLSGHTVSGVRLRRSTSSERVTLRDYDFEAPARDQTATAEAGKGKLELYEYPGGYKDPDKGKAIAAIRLEEARSRRTVLTGETTCRRLAAGYVVKLGGAARDEINARWLLVEVVHQLYEGGARTDQRPYTAQFVAVPADGKHRPKRLPVPKQGGLQTATVTAPPGSELHTEPHGRIKVKLRWDRRRPTDDTSSAWARVVQPPTSGGFFLPRQGWEALVDFQGKSADEPMILGRLYNGKATPPSGLPGKKVVSAFGTLTTPGGGSTNGLQMSDAAGSEGMTFTASKDYNEKTENDKVTNVTSNDSWSVGANRKVLVGQVMEQTVAGAQTYSVGASRTVNTDANMTIGAASESVLIGGMRIFNVGGDYHTTCSTLTRLVGGAKAEALIESQSRTVTGASSVMVGGSWNAVAGANAAINVLGASTETVAGAKTITAGRYLVSVRGAMSETLASRSVTAGSHRIEKSAATVSYTIGAGATFKGADVIVTATSGITIKASGVTVKITPSSVSISGEFDGGPSSVDDGDHDYD